MLKKKYKLIDNLNSLKSTTWLWNSLQGTCSWTGLKTSRSMVHAFKYSRGAVSLENILVMITNSLNAAITD